MNVYKHSDVYGGIFRKIIYRGGKCYVKKNYGFFIYGYGNSG